MDSTWRIRDLLIGAKRDISAQSAVVERLRDSSRRADDVYSIMAKFLSMMPVLTCVANHRNFIYVSPQWQNVLGWSTKELTSKPWISFVHPDDIAKTERVVERMKHGDVTGFFNRYLHKKRNEDGSPRWVELAWMSTEWDDSGKCYCVVAVVTDDQARCLWHCCPYKVNRDE